MGTCIFKTADIRRCVKHALSSAKWEMGYEEGKTPPAPALLFVHDQGVYVMSNGLPRDVKDRADKESGSYVAYADGCNPAIGTFAEWYGRSRELVGGDDFVEVLKLSPFWSAACTEFEELHIEVTPLTISTTFAKPATREEVPA